MKLSFDKVLSCFPENTVFNDSERYCDTFNFLQSSHFKISDEELNKISSERRKEMVKNMHLCMDELEDLTEPLWDYSSENEGWNSVINYIKSIIK